MIVIYSANRTCVCRFILITILKYLFDHIRLSAGTYRIIFVNFSVVIHEINTRYKLSLDITYKFKKKMVLYFLRLLKNSISFRKWMDLFCVCVCALERISSTVYNRLTYRSSFDKPKLSIGIGTTAACCEHTRARTQPLSHMHPYMHGVCHRI